ncbi:MAG: DnaJ domain-containing protein [Pseudomonadales bacterium]|jgi:hypothetical protein
MVLRNQALSVRQFFVLYISVLLALLLLFLGITGRLHPLFAVFGALLPFVMRVIPWIGRGNQAFKAFRYLKNILKGGSSSSRSPQQSEISTRYFQVVLIHDSGMMDGKVLEGKHEGSQLSNLNLQQLLTVLKECKADSDSYNVLKVYLDRIHEGWQDPSSGEIHETGNLTANQAYEVLGLSTGASKDEIVDAHRKLIQKMHPDRGGSTYLAARINEAKDKLLRK